jgi:transcription-repair coupling factor (superfamily II helicase)
LGSSQSGHVAAVGYELYLELLEGKIREMKGERVESETIDPEITVPISAFLPESFIPDTDQRLIAYKRLATASENGEIEELAAEWRDRYGPFPESTRSLLLLAMTRLLCRKLGIAKLDGEGDLLTLHFAGSSSVLELLAYLGEKKCTVIPESDRKLRVEVWAKSPAQRLLRLKKLLQGFLEHASHFTNQ